MEIKYFQKKAQDGSTAEQRVVVKSLTEESEDEKRVKLASLLTSGEGIILPIESDIGGNKNSQNFAFHFDGEFRGFSNQNGGDLIISTPDGDEIGAISFVLTKGKTSEETTAFISHKGYLNNAEALYGNQGLMKIGFSLLAEVLKKNGVRKVESHIVGGLAALKSRTNAPRLFGGGTYADATQEIEVDSTERPGRKEKVLVTTL